MARDPVAGWFDGAWLVCDSDRTNERGVATIALILDDDLLRRLYALGQ